MSRMAVPVQGATDARYAFLAGLLDDAGMFPPTSLPLAEAVQRHAGDRAQRPWLVARFLCPASRLEELATAVPEIADWRVGVICDRGYDVDFTATAAFGARAGTTIVDAIEHKLSEADPAADVAVICAGLAATLTPGLVPFLEIPLLGPAGGAVSQAVAAMAAARASDEWPGRAVAAKIRCGGVGPGTTPSVDAVSGAIVACVEAGVPLKATAGLHHPLRREDPATGEQAHGFFNVVGAALLLAAGKVRGNDVARVIGEDDPSAFSLSAEMFSWRDRSVTASEAAGGRAAAFTGFGSCSIDEPVEDLEQLGVLPLEHA